MGPDELNLNSGNLYIDGHKIGIINNFNIEMQTEEEKNTKFCFNRTIEGSFKFKRESRRRLFQWMHLNLENARLITIYRKTKKLRVKKKGFKTLSV